MHLRLLAALLVGISAFIACKTKEKENPPTEQFTYYESGAISRRVPLVNGKKDGKMIQYYADGKVMGERWFKEDRQVGRTVLYYPSGVLKEVQYYTDGEKQGGDTIWHENGRIQNIATFEAGKKHGYFRTWDAVGHLVVEVRYVRDTLVEVKGKKLTNQAAKGQ